MTLRALILQKTFTILKVLIYTTAFIPLALGYRDCPALHTDMNGGSIRKTKQKNT
jgi:hypothetical protein